MVRNAARVQLINDVVYVTYLESAEIDALIKQEMHEVFLRVTGGVKHRFLFEAEGGLWFTREGREYAASIEEKQPFLAVAMVAESLAFRLIADFYRRCYKPKVPYRVFKRKEDALEWLRTF